MNGGSPMTVVEDGLRPDGEGVVGRAARFGTVRDEDVAGVVGDERADAKLADVDRREHRVPPDRDCGA